ncbi:MAG: flavodoxin [Clostridiaceae bacterium]|nr:flavodoxin [Clostridiaceae bacterium]
MKKLVVFYSFEGNTRYIAQSITKAINADLLELKPKKDVKSKSFMKYLWGGKQVVLGQKPELERLDKDPNEYDFIIFGTPVWAFSYAPAFKTFFSQIKITKKKVALFCCNGGGKGKTFTNMREELKENDILGEIEFIDPIKGDEKKAEEAARWAKKIFSDIEEG